MQRIGKDSHFEERLLAVLFGQFLPDHAHTSAQIVADAPRVTPRPYSQAIISTSTLNRTFLVTIRCVDSAEALTKSA